MLATFSMAFSRLSVALNSFVFARVESLLNYEYTLCQRRKHLIQIPNH